MPRVKEGESFSLLFLYSYFILSHRLCCVKRDKLEEGRMLLKNVCIFDFVL